MSYSHMSLLPDRGLIEVSGADACAFLHGLVTNDIEAARPGQALFAGLLSPQGKILFDFLIHIRDRQSCWIDCPLEQAVDLARRLTLYKLRARIEIADRSANFAIGALWGDRPSEGMSGVLAAYADPRYAPLGERFVLPRGAQPAGAAAASIVGDAAYHAHRISLAVPQGGLDYAYGEAFPHEACYDDLNGVDFKKGCYVGQEVVSRMDHRGIAKTRIVAVRMSMAVEGGGMEILAGDVPVGQLGSTDGASGIAMVRLDRVESALRAGLPLHVGEVTLTVRRPSWASYAVPSAGAVS
jgi:folate-binding protein YgfZ